MDTIRGSISPLGIKVSGLISQAVLRGYSAYQIAVQNGFDGTMEEWLQSLRGETIQFKSEGLSIYYKYESDPDWTLLIEIDQLMADYDLLDHKPSINNVRLEGNKTLAQLGIQPSQNGYSLVEDTEIERLSHVDNYDDSEIRQAIEAIILAAVTGVKGVAESEFRKGDVTITPANIGLGNVDNTHDAAKHVLSAVQDSEGRVFGNTYFSGVTQSSGNTYLTRPDGTTVQVPVGNHEHDASEITSGIIDIARLPAGALERMVDVANRQERYALTTATVQNGDTVRQLDTGVMYRVVDDTKLNRADGYKEYTAGRASAVPWSGIEDKPDTFAPSAHTHTISQVTDIANASVAEAAKLKTARTIGITGGATASGVQFDGTGDVSLNVTDLDASLLSGTADISITGNAATATQFARERTIEVTGKATAAPKVYDGRQNIALEITDLDAAPKVHTHTLSQISDLANLQVDKITNFSTSSDNGYTDVWFSDSSEVGKPVHNSKFQYNSSTDVLKVGTVDGNLSGNAATATALTTNAGSATQPVYFANGIPIATTYELNKTVPADAVFTDTHYASKTVVAGSPIGKTDTGMALENGNVYLNHIENNAITASHQISGSGTATVTTDEYGNIIIHATSVPYEAGAGISVANNTIINTGVRSVAESSENGKITANINGTATDIPIHGLKSAAFTESIDYAMSNHRHDFSELQNKPTTLEGYGITDAAEASHGHDASDITSGTIDIARLPAAAVERLVVVADEQARFDLTINDIQNGDTVQQEDTGAMYRVVDDTKLDRAAGYKEYTAGSASSVPWSGVTGKPESYTPSAHTHGIADITDIASASVASAARLTTSAGANNQPVYFSNGVPVAIQYELNKTVPADAVFTDTHHTSTTIVNSANDSTTESSRAISNGNVFFNHIENGTVRSSHRFEGTGNVTVTYSNGDIIIHGADTVYTTLPNPYALSINGTTYDGSSAVDVGVIDVAHGGTGNSSVDSAPTADSTKMVTSGGIYTALAGKANSVHTHLYAGSLTAGGSAISAAKLDSDAGSVTQPVYFTGGKPTATTYSLSASVPGDAVFTDTHYASMTVVGGTNDATTDSIAALTNTHVFLNHIENGAVVSTHRISGTGSATVTADDSGNIIINAEDTKYTALPNPYALSINGKTYDGSAAVDAGVIDVAHGGTGNSSADSVPTENSTKLLPSGAIYTALQAKADTSHTHLYAGSSTAGGSAISAVKLDTSAGSAIQPIYFSGGKPVATTYSLETSVPSNAVFTDTHYASSTVVGGTDDATADTETALTNTHVFLNHIENGVVVSAHRISGTGATTVTTDSSGNILINSTDTKYTALPNPYSLSVNGKTYDGSEAVDVGVIDVAHGGTGNSSVDSTPTANSTKMVTSGGVYTALSGKADSDHTHLYAGASTAGGSASSAVKLDTSAGSGTQPIYFSGGKPVACTYALNKTVPADAVFTDTHYTSATVVASADGETTDTDSALTNTHVFLNHIENGAVTASHRISGTGATTVTTDSSGNILINSTDTKYTELPNPETLTIQGNGTTIDTYKGDQAKTINITYSNVGAAAASHGHAWSDISNTPTTLAGYGITDQVAAKNHVHDASAITTGVFDIARIPVAALERLCVVDDLAAMYQLTTSEIQIGDTVQCDDTKIMYRVVDNTNLDNASGYKEYVAGSASSVPWSGVTGKPETFTPSAHTHLYAGSSTAGGSATSAEKLNPATDAGSATNPVYFSNGKPAACTYSLNKTVPADAVFTDTHHTATNVITGTASGKADTSSVLSNGSVYLNLIENDTVRSSHKISGSDAVTVTTDASGNVVITAHDTKYTGSDGILLTGTNFTNTGVHSVSSGTTNGTISVNTNGTSAEVAVAGLGGAAYKAADYYALSGHTHSYAGSATSGGSATSAVRLDSGATGSETQPIYWTSGGKPAACTYSLNKTVPSDAVFTDTHNTSKNIVGASSSATANAAVSSGTIYLNHLEESTVTSSHSIAGTGLMSVSCTAAGAITIATTATKDSPYTGTITAVGSSASVGSSGNFARGDHTHNIVVGTGDSNGQVKIAGQNASVKGINTAAYRAQSYFATSGAHTETKSEDTSQKIFLIGAQSQSTSGVKTYSDNEVYVTNGVLTTKSTQIGGTAVTLQYNSTTKSLDFVFA